MTPAEAEARRDPKRHRVISEHGQYGVRAQLSYRGSPERREGESHPRISDVTHYNTRYVSAIGLGFSLADSLDHAKEIR